MTRRIPPRWWRVGLGAAAIAVAVFCLVTAWTGIAGSNPAYLITLNVAALAAAAVLVSGLVARIQPVDQSNRSPASDEPDLDGEPDANRKTDSDADAAADADGEPDPGGEPDANRKTDVAAANPETEPAATPTAARARPAVVTALSRGVAVTSVIVLLLGLIWLRPLGAQPIAIDAMADGRDVTVTVARTRIELRPTTPGRHTGLVFYPGALVDPRAYAAILRPLAEAGYPVIIVKAPYDIAFFDADAATSIMAADAATTRWVVAGHSLGGVVAAEYAGGGHAGVAGLLLWASFPASSIAGATALQVTSVSGSNDGLSTAAKVDAAKGKLPPATRYVVVEGAVHSDFGDYGEQPGDGVATISRADAQAQIRQASLELLDRVDRVG